MDTAIKSLNIKFDIRDRRQTEWFWCDKSILRSEINHSFKLVYFALCSFSNEKTQSCYPSIRTLSRMAGVSPRTTINALYLYKQAKLILVKKTSGRVNEYTLLPVTSAKIAQVVHMQLETQNLRNGDNSTYATGETKHTNSNIHNNKGLENLRKKMKEIGLIRRNQE